MHTKPHSQGVPETEGRIINSWAPFYDKLVNLLTLGKEQKAREEAVTLAKIQPGEHILDVGCGTGNLTLTAARRVGANGEVAGIDPAPNMIAAAKSKATQKEQSVDFRVGVIEKLSFSDSSFDAVLSSLMFHHLPNELKLKGVAEVYRVLKPGGRLAIIELDSTRFSLINFIHGRPTRENKLAIQLERMLSEQGFGEIELKEMRYGSLSFIMRLKPL